MILDQEIIAQIKRRQRTMVRLPRKSTIYPVREGRAYTVRTSIRAKPSCEITIDSCEPSMFEDKPGWVIRFKLGNHTDQDRYPAAKPGPEGDYTSVPARKLTGTGAEVSAEEQNHYAGEAHERHRARLDLGLEKWREATAKLRGEAPTARQRKRLGSIEYQIAALRRENGL